MTELLQLRVKGLALGSAYGLVALGFVVIFKATGVVNFAQGSFAVVARNSSFVYKGPGADASPPR